MVSTSTVLVTATRRISAGSRWVRAQASAMLSLMRLRFSVILFFMRVGPSSVTASSRASVLAAGLHNV